MPLWSYSAKDVFIFGWTLCLCKCRSVQHSDHRNLTGLKLLADKLLTRLMNVSHAANGANRRGLMERASPHLKGKHKYSIQPRGQPGCRGAVSRVKTLRAFSQEWWSKYTPGSFKRKVWKRIHGEEIETSQMVRWEGKDWLEYYTVNVAKFSFSEEESVSIKIRFQRFFFLV